MAAADHACAFGELSFNQGDGLVKVSVEWSRIEQRSEGGYPMMATSNSAVTRSALTSVDPAPDTEVLARFLGGVAQHRSSEWAWQHYESTVQDLISLLNVRTILEIGGGRWPLLDGDEIRSTGIRYIVNDISPSELALAPTYVEKACFDISQAAAIDDDHLEGNVDLMFSQMVFEHVSDAHQAYRNIYRLLSPGGVCLNFHPVLYSLPFVVNWMLPEQSSARLLHFFFPYRSPDEVPKYPAKYDHCWVSRGEQEKLRSIGFRNVWQVPFWYHNYFKNIPGLYQADTTLTRFAERNNWTALASFCYTCVMK
jgi:SAM-dependent methyltransferase